MKDFRLYQKPKSIVFTEGGYKDLQEKYDALKNERPSAVDNLKRARELGDLSENGFYKASRQRLSYIDSQLVRFGHQLKYGIIKKASQTEIVELGSSVTLQTENEEVMYSIVGVHEANPTDGKISVVSPLGSQLIGKKVGDSVRVRDFNYKVLKIS